MDQAEYLNKREEYVAKAALMGMTYDWFDHTFSIYEDGAGARIYDPDTGELLAESRVNFEKFKQVVNERVNKYGGKQEAQSNHGQVGTDTPEGNS